MHERQRLHYLSTLGIDYYAPRRVLAGAATSVPLSAEHWLPVPESQKSATMELNAEHIKAGTDAADVAATPGQSAEPSSVAPASIAAPTATPLADALLSPSTKGSVQSHDDSGSRETVQNAQNESAENNKAIADTSIPVSFVLHIWRINDECLVIDSREPGTALPTERLLQNILRVMGYPLAQLPQSETLRWPLFGDSGPNVSSKNGMAADEEQARAMVQAYVGAQMNRAPLGKMLLMGAAATRYTLEADTDFENINGSIVSPEHWQTQAAITPSLFTLLQEPWQKAIAWQALQLLIAH